MQTGGFGVLSCILLFLYTIIYMSCSEPCRHTHGFQETRNSVHVLMLIVIHQDRALICPNFPRTVPVFSSQYHCPHKV